MRINGRQFHIGKLYYVMAFFAFFFCINGMTAIASQLGKKEIVFSMSPKGYPRVAIFITGYAQEMVDLIRQTLDETAQTCLTKPLDMAQLLGHLKEIYAANHDGIQGKP